MKNLTIKLPAEVCVDDYHEFFSIVDFFKQVGVKVKIREVGAYFGQWHGILYRGSIKDPAFKKLKKEMVIKLKTFGNL